MSEAQISDLHDAAADHSRIETLATDWESVLQAALDQWQVWGFALVTFGLAAFGFLHHEGWYGEATFGLLTLAALGFGVRQMREQLRRY
ncbi:hypothetical protein [Halorarius litoreus]|uniref:hypothetical protein n=1 Tax=Halorarius litoreus TaxID=2962676 RepID=UPI0020CD07E2|nr:hypothetical protein [Halorarius litoreus]